MVDVVRSTEQVQGDGLSAISVVGIIFLIPRKEDGAVVGNYDGYSSHPRIVAPKPDSVTVLSRSKEGIVRIPIYCIVGTVHVRCS